MRPTSADLGSVSIAGGGSSKAILNSTLYAPGYNTTEQYTGLSISGADAGDLRLDALSAHV